MCAFAIGPGTQVIARRLFNKMKYCNVKYFCTDGNYAYNKVLPKEKHILSKSETCLVESFNAKLKHYVPSLRKRRMCYVKSRKNTGFGCIFINA